LELNAEDRILSKKEYVSPVIKKIRLDNTISIIMMTVPENPGKPPPWTPPGGGKGKDPFESPFEDKPFG